MVAGTTCLASTSKKWPRPDALPGRDEPRCCSAKRRHGGAEPREGSAKIISGHKHAAFTRSTAHRSLGSGYLPASCAFSCGRFDVVNRFCSNDRGRQTNQKTKSQVRRLPIFTDGRRGLSEQEKSIDNVKSAAIFPQRARPEPATHPQHIPRAPLEPPWTPCRRPHRPGQPALLRRRLGDRPSTLPNACPPAPLATPPPPRSRSADNPSPNVRAFVEEAQKIASHAAEQVSEEQQT